MYLDGTHGVIEGYLLHILSVKHHGKVVPVVYGLLTSKELSMYVYFLEQIRRKMGPSWIVPSIWHTDFEETYKLGTFIVSFSFFFFLFPFSFFLSLF